MSTKLSQLANRRHKLIAQAASQRETLQQCIAPWRAPLTLADRGLSAIRYVKSSPMLMMGTMALLGILRPTRAGKWLHRSWVLLQVARGWLSKP
jgi:hypothetical protein